MSGQEYPSARLQYRLGQDLDLHYGRYASEHYASDTLLVTQDFVNNIQKCRTTCYKYNAKIKYQIVGIGSARTFSGYCNNSRCNFESNLIYDDNKLDNFYLQNLAYILYTVTYVTGYAGYKSLSHVIRRDRLCKDSYYNHVYFLYTLMNTFYYNNKAKVHQDIKEFHARNLYNRPNYEEN